MKWRISSAYPCYYHLVLDEKDLLIVACRDFEIARLIANAPQMLAALEAIRDKARRVLLSTYAPGGTHQPHRDAADWETVRGYARTAIAAVKGENGDDIG